MRMGNLWSRLHKYIDKLQFPHRGSRLQRYGFVIILVSLFFLIKSTLIAVFGNYFPFLFAAFTVVLCAWVGGFGPGVIATFLVAGVIYYAFLDPFFSINGGNDIQNLSLILIFLIQGFIISMISESHKKSDTQKNEFIGIISHELKNPLASIKGFAELIRKESEKKYDRRLIKYSKIIDSQVVQLTQMINEMLDITTIETGRLTYHDEIFRVQDLVKEIITNQQVYTYTHKIILKGQVAKKIKGDKYRIGQVISNLITNAVKYSQDTKKPQVIIRIKSYTGGVEIQVKDFGPGISHTDQRSIFKPFYRSKKTHATKGTGIGLYISTQIIQRHKGRLWCESTVGKGSTFYVRLPSGLK